MHPSLSPSDYHPVRYWLQDSPGRLQNFGDYLTEMLLDRLFVLPSFQADAYHLIGSVITESQMRRDLAALAVPTDTGLVAFWGCGLRDEQTLSAWAASRGRFFGVRGPLSRDVLGLPADTVLGDPGLLVPLLLPQRLSKRIRKSTLCIVHLLDPKPDDEIRRSTGADQVLRAGIPGNMAALTRMLATIAAAEFVLSGALHGAIVSCAYRVPFAFFDSGYVDVPFKWRDFAASVHLPCSFAKTVNQGIELYREESAPSYRALPLLPLLAGAPFTVRHSMMLKALGHDGHLAAGTLRHVVASLEAQGIDCQDSVARAQAAWLEGVALRRVARGYPEALSGVVT